MYHYKFPRNTGKRQLPLETRAAGHILHEQKNTRDPFLEAQQTHAQKPKYTHPLFVPGKHRTTSLPAAPPGWSSGRGFPVWKRPGRQAGGRPPPAEREIACTWDKKHTRYTDDSGVSNESTASHAQKNPSKHLHRQDMRKAKNGQIYQGTALHFVIPCDGLTYFS